MDAVRRFEDDPLLGNKPVAQWDVAGLLKLMWETWNDVFGRTLGRAERSLVQEVRDWRNKWAHQEPFSGDDTDRALDSMARLLTAVSAPQADEVNRMKMELRRLIFEEQARSERRKSAGTAIESQVTGTLKPWREVVTPHRDVASGRYQQAEFAADLWQVHLGEGTDEYRNPVEFFRRTFLTESLKDLLIGAMRRLAGEGGDPVVAAANQLRRRQDALDAGAVPPVFRHRAGRIAGRGRADGRRGHRRAAAQGEPRRAGGEQDLARQPVAKPDGTVVRRCGANWPGSLAGRRHSSRSGRTTRRATSPGDMLRKLMNEYGPCLILIDEWVAYARQLHDHSDLPAGELRDAFHLRPGADRIGEARQTLPARDQPAGLRHRRLAACPGRRRGSGRHARTGGA